MAHIRICRLCICCVAGLLFPGEMPGVFAQEDAAPPAVGDSIAARVLAESQARKTDAATTVQLAGANNKWLDVELRHAQAFWEKRLAYIENRQAIAEAERAALNSQQALSEAKSATRQRQRQLKLSREWALLQNHPEVNGPNIRNGRSLNFLLNRLNVNLLAYGYVLDDNQEAKAFLDELRLTPEMVHGLNLRQTISVDNASARFVDFPADGGEAIRITYWPFLLRGPVFAAERRAIEEANIATTLTISDGPDDVNPAVQLAEAIARLTDKFHEVYPLDEIRDADTHKVLQYSEAERFLRFKKIEVFRSPQIMIGDQSQLRFELAAEGDHLVALLTFMTRNGLSFGSCSPGNEPVYEQVFLMMRDLFRTDIVAEELEQLPN